MTSNSLFIKVDEIATELDVSKSHAYKLARKMNEELSNRGFLTVSGRVSRKYFLEKIYGTNVAKEKGE